MTGVISAYRSPNGEYAGIEYAALPVSVLLRISGHGYGPLPAI
jgi:hypothetical protein